MTKFGRTWRIRKPREPERKIEERKERLRKLNGRTTGKMTNCGRRTK